MECHGERFTRTTFIPSLRFSLSHAQSSLAYTMFVSAGSSGMSFNCWRMHRTVRCWHEHFSGQPMAFAQFKRATLHNAISAIDNFLFTSFISCRSGCGLMIAPDSGLSTNAQLFSLVKRTDLIQLISVCLIESLIVFSLPHRLWQSFGSEIFRTEL